MLYHPAHKIYSPLGPSVPLAIYYRELQPMDTASTALQAAAQGLEITASCQDQAGSTLILWNLQSHIHNTGKGENQVAHPCCRHQRWLRVLTSPPSPPALLEVNQFSTVGRSEGRGLLWKEPPGLAVATMKRLPWPPASGCTCLFFLSSRKDKTL